MAKFRVFGWSGYDSNGNWSTNERFVNANSEREARDKFKSATGRNAFKTFKR